MQQFTGSVLIDQSVSDYYVSGPLKRTLFSGTVASSLSERISTFSGGRFRDITYNKYLLEISIHLTGNRSLNFPLTGSTPLEVIAPKDLQSTRPPVLSRDAEGKMCVYTGRQPGRVFGTPFQVPMLSLLFTDHTSTLLFSPLSGEKTVDTEVVTQALARLRENDPNRYTFEFDRFDGTRGTDGRPPQEIIMICFDNSGSMGSESFSGSSRDTEGPELSRVYPFQINLTPFS